MHKIDKVAKSLEDFDFFVFDNAQGIQGFEWQMMNSYTEDEINHSVKDYKWYKKESK